MARCPSCLKFASYDEPEVEMDSEDVSEDGTFYGTVHVTLNSACCGDAVKEAYIEVEETVDHECDAEELKAHREKLAAQGGEDASDVEDAEEDADPTYELESVDVESHDRYEDTVRGKNGKEKKITNPRYMKHYLGAELTVNCRCLKCGAEFSHKIIAEEQASAFEELA